jgi:hypothetical protein
MKDTEGSSTRGGRRVVRLVTSAAVALVVLGAPRAGLACSICRCGDATFNALGKDGYAAEGFRAALDWERFDKTEGDPADESESQVENRVTALLSYGFTERFTLFARVPYSVRNLTSTADGLEPEKTHTRGFSDPEIYGQVRLWASRLGAGLGRRASLSVTGGVKAPWGQNDAQKDGERADEHAQPGTGSTDAFGSLAFLYLVDKDSAVFASSGYRYTGRNDFGYRYGRTFLANVAYEHKLGKVLDGVVELNFRHAQKDQVDADGTTGDSTGGSLLYVTPRLLASLGRGLVLRATVQIPVARDLNGFQKERAVANVGLTYVVR